MHRLSDVGAVVTHVAHGISQGGFDAEWRDTNVVTVDGDLVDRSELFDATDLDAALARFDELSAPTLLLENEATRAWACVADAFNRRDGEAMFALASADIRYEDRRKGLRDAYQGAEARKAIDAMLEMAPGSWRVEITPVAVRGSRVALTRRSYRDIDDPAQSITVDVLDVTEVDADGLMRHTMTFDPDDTAAAFEQLDARYLAGEAAACSDSWSVVTRAYAALNRRELPATTPDWVNVDHRRGRAFAPGELFAFLRAAWEVTPDLSIYVAAVHRLSRLGAVVTHTASGNSREGFGAEWQTIELLTFESDLINHCEMFDVTDLDTALARFDELHPHVGDEISPSGNVPLSQ